MTTMTTPPPSDTSEHKRPSRGVRATRTIPASAQLTMEAPTALQSATLPACGASTRAITTAITPMIAAAKHASRSRDADAVRTVERVAGNVPPPSRVLRACRSSLRLDVTVVGVSFHDPTVAHSQYRVGGVGDVGVVRHQDDGLSGSMESGK